MSAHGNGQEMTAPRLVAHRGAHAEASGGARENTLAAIRDAVADGASWVEIDVRLTRDGEVVLVHDETLERMWGDLRRIGEVDLSEIRELGGGARRIPLLAEALDALDGTGVTLLIDMDEENPAVAAAAVVRAASADTATAWCGDPDAMRAVRAELPDAAIWMPWFDVVPPRAADLAELRPTVLNLEHLLVGPALVDAAHSLGVEVSAWTVDDADQAVHLARIGVDSITTNDLRAVRAGLAAGTVDETARALSIVTELATRAAETTAAARQDGPGPVRTKKDPADHVTDVDQAIERWTRAVLGAQFPDHDMVGEEYGGTTDGSRPCWYLDPVDGTANLANGVPWTSFSLALVRDGAPVVAAVLDPVGDTLDGTSAPVPVVAAAGRGAWRRGRRLLTSPSRGADPLSGTMATTELAGARPWDGFHELVDELAARHCTLRVPGSGTATLAGVALGRGTAAVVHRYSPIDHAAALLVVAEAGGAVLSERGEPSLHPVGGGVVTGVDEAAALALWRVWRDAVERAEGADGALVAQPSASAAAPTAGSPK